MKMLTNNILIKTAAHFGTPVFLYFMETIKEKYAQLQKNLSPSCSVFYSIKANPSLEVCKYLASLGANCEISSKNELVIALKSGFKPSQIIFVGPAKKPDEIEFAIQMKIRHIVCESITEISLVDVLSKKHKAKTSILARINPDFFMKNAPIKMSGVSSQFGIEITEFTARFNEIQQCEFILFDGIQIFNASRVLDENAIIENIKNILILADSLSEKLKIDFNVIDIGGGFGVPYFQGEKKLNHLKLINDINALLKCYKLLRQSTQFILELGRYLVAESGFLIASIQSVKSNHEKNYLIVDAGLHCHMATTGLGSFIHRNFPFFHISENKLKNSISKKKYQVTGPLCTPCDVLLKNIELKNVTVGDLIIIKNSGAYGLTASPGKFLSHGSPAEVIYENKKLKLIRRRETIDDLLLTQNINATETFKQVCI
ncbi:MAG: hypothetical protein A3E82_09140 [Gammaproteobacteria bacterium RIFCSPHIGHO2_12_FULL_38_11]|nr:MAG: hypothetical protein A3E82_09140 [Gammaproteobacteria bacterium RIFCSPHIGHO2_12_FULL_38_11]